MSCGGEGWAEAAGRAVLAMVDRAPRGRRACCASSLMGTSHQCPRACVPWDRCTSPGLAPAPPCASGASPRCAASQTGPVAQPVRWGSARDLAARSGHSRARALRAAQVPPRRASVRVGWRRRAPRSSPQAACTRPVSVPAAPADAASTAARRFASCRLSVT
eukprot:scaffold31903_cov104-Isochrysis_galbana.AAC.2